MLKLNPRDFISEPITSCPACGEESFGRLMVSGRHHTRRCYKCFHDVTARLPDIRKKIIYLDQCAISNMMKALNPRHPAHTRPGLKKEMWLDVFARLDSMGQGQLLTCPSSLFHLEESLVDPFYKELKRVWDQLSHGTSLNAPSTIQHAQVCQHAVCWLRGQVSSFDFDAQSIANGSLHEWNDTIMVTLKFKHGADEADELRRTRDLGYETLATRFEGWKSETGMTREDFMRREAMAFGTVTLQIFAEYTDRLAQLHQPGFPPEKIQETINAMINIPPQVRLVHNLTEICKQLGLSTEQALIKTTELLVSPSLLDVPSVRLFSMLWAAIAWKALHSPGMKPPNRGTLTDAEMISSLLPYCDAIFVDDKMKAFLSEEPLRSEVLKFGTKVFSQNCIQEFITFLDTIENEAQPAHKDLVRQVYGERKPYMTMLEHEEDDD